MRKELAFEKAQYLANAWGIDVIVFPFIGDRFWGYTDSSRELDDYQMSNQVIVKPNGNLAPAHYAAVVLLFGETNRCLASFPHSPIDSIMRTYDDYVENKIAWFGKNAKIELRVWPRRPENWDKLITLAELNPS